MRIGLFGGSFNPVHNGHLAVARGILAEAALDEVWFMVSPQNPLKRNADLLDDEQRLALVRLALEGEHGLVACDYEFRLPRPSYTWNTLKHLADDYPQHRFSLIIGGDNWACFSQWVNAADILSRHNIIVYPRHGADIAANSLPPTVRLVNTPFYDISSTEIRQRLRNGQSIHGLVPEAVEREISLSKLYQANVL